MILIDTGPLVALIDPRDGLHRRARADLPKLEGRPLGISLPVLTETLLHLPSRVARQKLRALMEELEMFIREVDASTITASLDWLDRYAEHEPDLADAITVVLSSEPRSEVWTYDREFRTTWRRPDGSPVPLVVRP